ncbi:hypothetical protein ACFVX6_23005 [Streptomyces sp. NPDC058289]
MKATGIPGDGFSGTTARRPSEYAELPAETVRQAMSHAAAF